MCSFDKAMCVLGDKGWWGWMYLVTRLCRHGWMLCVFGDKVMYVLGDNG